MEITITLTEKDMNDESAVALVALLQAVPKKAVPKTRTRRTAAATETPALPQTPALDVTTDEEAATQKAEREAAAAQIVADREAAQAKAQAVAEEAQRVAQEAAAAAQKIADDAATAAQAAANAAIDAAGAAVSAAEPALASPAAAPTPPASVTPPATAAAPAVEGDGTPPETIKAVQRALQGISALADRGVALKLMKAEKDAAGKPVMAAQKLTVAGCNTIIAEFEKLGGQAAVDAKTAAVA